MLIWWYDALYNDEVAYYKVMIKVSYNMHGWSLTQILWWWTLVYMDDDTIFDAYELLVNMTLEKHESKLDDGEIFVIQ